MFFLLIFDGMAAFAESRKLKRGPVLAVVSLTALAYISVSAFSAADYQKDLQKETEDLAVMNAYGMQLYDLMNDPQTSEWANSDTLQGSALHHGGMSFLELQAALEEEGITLVKDAVDFQSTVLTGCNLSNLFVSLQGRNMRIWIQQETDTGNYGQAISGNRETFCADSELYEEQVYNAEAVEMDLQTLRMVYTQIYESCCDYEFYRNKINEREDGRLPDLGGSGESLTDINAYLVSCGKDAVSVAEYPFESYLLKTYTEANIYARIIDGQLILWVQRDISGGNSGSLVSLYGNRMYLDEDDFYDAASVETDLQTLRTVYTQIYEACCDYEFYWAQINERPAEQLPDLGGSGESLTDINAYLVSCGKDAVSVAEHPFESFVLQNCKEANIYVRIIDGQLTLWLQRDISEGNSGSCVSLYGSRMYLEEKDFYDETSTEADLQTLKDLYAALYLSYSKEAAREAIDQKGSSELSQLSGNGESLPAFNAFLTAHGLDSADQTISFQSFTLKGLSADNIYVRVSGGSLTMWLQKNSLSGNSGSAVSLQGTVFRLNEESFYDESLVEEDLQTLKNVYKKVYKRYNKKKIKTAIKNREEGQLPQISGAGQNLIELNEFLEALDVKTLDEDITFSSLILQNFSAENIYIRFKGKTVTVWLQRKTDLGNSGTALTLGQTVFYLNNEIMQGEL